MVFDEAFDRDVMPFFNDSVYDELISVPLLFHHGDGSGAGTRIAERVGIVDLGPTLAELMALPPLGAVAGRSYAALARGEQSAIGPSPYFLERRPADEKLVKLGWWKAGDMFGVHAVPHDEVSVAQIPANAEIEQLPVQVPIECDRRVTERTERDGHGLAAHNVVHDLVPDHDPQGIGASVISNDDLNDGLAGLERPGRGFDRVELRLIEWRNLVTPRAPGEELLERHCVAGEVRGPILDWNAIPAENRCSLLGVERGTHLLDRWFVGWLRRSGFRRWLRLGRLGRWRIGRCQGLGSAHLLLGDGL